jgi:hypothetical protein
MKIAHIFLLVASALTSFAEIFTRADSVVAFDESQSRILGLTLDSSGRLTEAIFSLSAELRGDVVETKAARRFIFDPATAEVMRVEKLQSHQVSLMGYKVTPLIDGLLPNPQKSAPQVVVTYKKDTGVLNFIWAASISPVPGGLLMRNCVFISHESKKPMPSIALSDLFEIKK